MALVSGDFPNPNHVVPGGFTALAMFANRLWGGRSARHSRHEPAFLLIGMRVLGMQFGPKTLFAAAAVALA